MARPTGKKPRGAYHHGDLERALVDAAARTIRAEGVRGLTLRGVGAAVGVSRTALYRHFEDKSALIARVALEGFRRFHAALEDGIAKAAKTKGGKAHGDVIAEMGLAYVRFAAANPSYYDVMFGECVDDWERYPDLQQEAAATFTLLVDTVAAEQARGRFGPGNPVELAEIIWSISHGMVMLSAGKHLNHTDATVEDLIVMSSRMLKGAFLR